MRTKITCQNPPVKDFFPMMEYRKMSWNLKLLQKTLKNKGTLCLSYLQTLKPVDFQRGKLQSAFVATTALPTVKTEMPEIAVAIFK